MRLPVALCALLLLAACAEPLRALAPRRRPGPFVYVRSPFDPVALRVHPLTHVQRRAPGLSPDECLLVLHVELTDAYADSVKGLGLLTVELFRPGSGPTPGMEVQSRRWRIEDLLDPESNSARYDPSTRTYRIPLVAEAWVAEWLDPANAPLRAGAPPWVKVRATLETLGRDDRPILLADEFIVQR